MTAEEKRKYAELLEEHGDEEKATWWWMRWKCQTDTYYLGVKVLKLFDTPKGRKRLDPKFHRAMCRELDKPGDSLLMYARDHLKSSWVQVWIVRQILADPNHRIGFFTKTAKLAANRVAVIKTYFDRPLLQKLFPEYDRPRDKWEVNQQDQFTIHRPKDEGYVPADNQLEAWGVGQSVTGKHYDFHVYDDIIDKETVSSATQLEKVDEWWSGIQPLLDPDAVDKMIGTPYFYRDLYHRIWKEGLYPKENCVWMPAKIGNKFVYKFFNETILEKRRKRMTPYDFSCQYMLDTTPKEDRLFPPPYPIFRELPQTVKYYITVDPAATATKYSDKTGISVAAVDTTDPSTAFFVEAQGYKEKPERIVEILVRKILHYRPWRVGIELGLQKALMPLLEHALEKAVQGISGFRWPEFVDIPTRQGMADKTDKLNRTIGAFIRAERARLLADENGEYAVEVKQLADQMDWYNPNVDKNDDDVLDSAGMMIQTIEHFAPAHWKHGEQERRAKRDWAWHKARQRKAKRNKWEARFAN